MAYIYRKKHLSKMCPQMAECVMLHDNKGSTRFKKTRKMCVKEEGMILHIEHSVKVFKEAF